jgi:5'-phosphate synthase pdxT subunit
MTSPRVGVLALQGAFAAHATVLGRLGVETVDVRLPRDLDVVDALVLPGGESTTMSLLLTSSGLIDPLAARLAAGMPAFGTCAGMILLAARIVDGTTDQVSFGAIDIDVRRNAYGRQIDSFETDMVIDGDPVPFRAPFIRAPQIVRRGPSVEALATVDGDVVLARQGAVLVASFHPELTADDRVHRMFLGSIREE